MSRKIQHSWRFYPDDTKRQDQLARELKISSLLARCLLNRALEDPQEARDYLQPELGQLVDPGKFHQMETAVARVRQALENKERILIHGDYDVDGVSGTVLLCQLFRLLGADVVYHIPNRLRDGFSFGPRSLERIREAGATLVITIDNGVSALGPITDLREAGVDVIITDHHQPTPGDPLPPAAAILNPNLPDSGYPHGFLCGVAVAFKLAWGIAQSLSPTRRASPAMKQFLLDAMGWVAIGTISDLVPLRGENRVLAKFGLAALERSRHPGVRALLAQVGLAEQRLTAEDVAFKIAPRLNAAGRLGAAEKAVDLLTTGDETLAQDLAAELDECNERRRDIERRIYEEARARVRKEWDFTRWPVIILGDPNWHAGVVGIVCSRLMEEFHCPVILVAFEGEEGRGSARSLAGFNIHEAMAAGADLVIKYGGHAQAAGLEIRADQLEAYRDRVNERAREMLREGEKPKILNIDAEIPLSSLTRNFMREVGRLGPYGVGNQVPVFATREVRITGIPRRVGKNREHLQFQALQGTQKIKAIAFRMGDRAEEIIEAESLTLAYTPKLNHWAGRQSLNLEIRDFLVEGSLE